MIKIGAVLVSLFDNPELFYSLKSIYIGKFHSTTKIIPNDLLHELMNSFSIKEITDLPMICPPKEWSIDQYKN